MSVEINNQIMESMVYNGTEVQTWIHDGVEVYTAGRMVTYLVDTDVSYQEKVKKGQTCLSPTTFTPSKSGWIFVGWREDGKASGEVLKSKVMANEPITLYAVYKQDITLTYNGNGNTSGSTASQTGTRYYNASGDLVNASIVLRSSGFAKTGYSFSKWAADTASGTQYSAGATIVCTANTTMYAVWTRNAVTNKVLASGAKGTVSAGGTTGTVYFDTTGFTTITVTLSVTSTYGYGWIANSKTDFSGAAYHISGSNTQTKTITLKANSGSQPISYKVRYDTGYGGNSSNTEWKVTVTAK